jgi:glycosyltransferase involved in cell wall biosynthesis
MNALPTDAGRRPKVSIILPTFNRSRFLPQAFQAIASQSFADWELIFVDDGSTDDTRLVVADERAKLTQPVRYVHQENQGAYGARNTGLDHATGHYVAFYDSDDLWLPHHLSECVAALEACPEVDWVYAASRMVDYSDGRVLAPHCFYVAGRPRPFLRLGARAAGALRVIADERAVECALLRGLFAGLQCSVMRRELFTDWRFESASRNEAEDQLAVVRALAAGRTLAYLDAVHVVYHVHAQNSSAPKRQTLDKHVRVFRALVAGFEELRRQVPLTRRQSRALDRRLSRECFWHLGYRLLHQPGHGAEALAWLRRGLRLWPTNLRYWKTYALARLRVAARREPSAPIPA